MSDLQNAAAAWTNHIGLFFLLWPHNRRILWIIFLFMCFIVVVVVVWEVEGSLLFAVVKKQKQNPKALFFNTNNLLLFIGVNISGKVLLK